jgi:hypothetical protein
LAYALPLNLGESRKIGFGEEFRGNLAAFEQLFEYIEELHSRNLTVMRATLENAFSFEINASTTDQNEVFYHSI